ncbi:MAG: hypothetical protein J0G98_08310 [Terrimonas ferruginea]|uniref:hypothetical protein n=1 Tax=Terrimonas ferruginea TaxID=249 RepID=UPI000927BE6B|nr:hypothetical protein [Terrimonas ferruginea]MBN8783052.1 hypothetical protein [Terrimonas ferruginea]OJW44230.1 MAG: hypothetical protein BGO56_20315 [Sphingobacteriales bacterium 48-107]
MNEDTKNEQKLRRLLKKGLDHFIPVKRIMHHWAIDKEEAISLATQLEERGLLEKAPFDNAWIISLRGELLLHKNVPRRFARKTIHEQLNKLLRRADIVNKSGKFPYYVEYLKLIDPLPADEYGGPLRIIYRLQRKPISSEVYDQLSRKLIQETKKKLYSVFEHLAYPQEAVRLFLKERSQVLKLLAWETEIQDLPGQLIFESVDVK